MVPKEHIMLEIDGSYGEGGGQILRTALSFSCLTGRPFRIFNIRRGRRKPGLMPQHLAAVRAAQAITDATVQGAEPGATSLSFFPQAVKGGEFQFDIGTAGSVTLLLQTLIPPLLHAGQPSTLTLTGGTHVPSSPSAHYLAEVFAPTLKRLGVEIRLTVESYGFYPRGGGKIRAHIVPTREIRPLQLTARGDLRDIAGSSVVCHLPLTIAERQRTAALATLEAILDSSHRLAKIDLLPVPGLGQGTFLFLRVDTETGRAGFTALGSRGKPAETVGAEAATELCHYLSTKAALDPHLADQLVPFLALGRAESAFSTSRITPHLLTNLWTANIFRPLNYRLTGQVEQPGEVTISPA
jgi:RNA 3'-terminal phosphate cyclase (ATP)